jgi:DNA (cytosine-5)-methyltransferase 1
VGGLTHGLRKAGFRVTVAVELNETAAKTYAYNNRQTDVLVEDISDVTVADVLDRAGANRVALVAGCAPCQGFCSLTQKHKREDPRNRLLLEMLRLIEGIKPEAVLMENVPRLLTRGRAIFEEFSASLKKASYLPTVEVVQMADYGVPQYRRRVVLLAGKGFEIPFPKPTHAKNPEDGSDYLPWVSVREATGHLRAPTTLADAMRAGGPERLNWHVVSNLQPQTKRRLKAAIPGKTWLRVKESIRPECHREGYDGFTNTYGRMRWDEVSPTITSGCTTPCKGRFGHPDGRRYTISVREAALLQTFPETYRLRTDQIEAACGLIGNAVPPLYAKAVGKAIKRALEARDVALAGER